MVEFQLFFSFFSPILFFLFCYSTSLFLCCLSSCCHLIDAFASVLRTSLLWFYHVSGGLCTRGVSVVVGGTVSYWANKITQIASQNCLLSVLCDSRKKKSCLETILGRMVKTNIHIDWGGSKDWHGVWQHHTRHPLGHTNYILKGFIDSRSDTVYFGSL